MKPFQLKNVRNIIKQEKEGILFELKNKFNITDAKLSNYKVYGDDSAWEYIECKVKTKDEIFHINFDGKIIKGIK